MLKEAAEMCSFAPRAERYASSVVWSTETRAASPPSAGAASDAMRTMSAPTLIHIFEPPELESCALATQASRFVLVNASDLGASAIQTPVVEKELHPRRDQSPT